MIVDGLNARTLNLPAEAVLRALRAGGDAHNVFDVIPTLRDRSEARLYSPLWDLHVGVYTPKAVAQGLNTAKKDSDVIERLSDLGLVTSPGGTRLRSNREIINCPALGFPDEPPLVP